MGRNHPHLHYWSLGRAITTYAIINTRSSGCPIASNFNSFKDDSVSKEHAKDAYIAPILDNVTMEHLKDEYIFPIYLEELITM